MDHPTPVPSPDPPAHRPLGRRKLWLFRLAAVGLALVAAFLILEIAVRVLVSQPYGTIEDLRRFQENKRTAERLTLIHLIRPSDNRALVYEMIPGVEGEFWGAPVRINSSGQHDPERSVEKPSGTWRLAALGDSVLFGWGVPIHARFSSLLESFLNETATTGSAASVSRFEVLNFGVPGYNTRMEAEVLRARASRYAPDAVLVTFVPDNDARLPNFIVKPRNRLSLRRSYLLEAVRRRDLRGLRASQQAGLRAANNDDVPDEYRFLAGDKAMVEGMEEIRRYTTDAGLPLLLMPYCFNVDQLDASGRVTSAAPESEPELARRALETARSLGYTVVDPRPGAGRYIGRRGETWEALMLDLERQDLHPNLVYHALMAKELYRSLVESRVLPDWQTRQERLDADLARWDRIIEQAQAEIDSRKPWSAAP